MSLIFRFGVESLFMFAHVWHFELARRRRACIVAPEVLLCLALLYSQLQFDLRPTTLTIARSCNTRIWRAIAPWSCHLLLLHFVSRSLILAVIHTLHLPLFLAPLITLVRLALLQGFSRLACRHQLLVLRLQSLPLLNQLL